MKVGYARVSLSDGRQDTALQIDALVEAGVDQRHIFEDKASGARDDRPALKKVLAYLKEGDTLVVWKLDRLGRSLSHLLQIVQDLNKRGIGFQSVTQSQIDTSTPEGRLFLQVIGMVSEYERELTRERTIAGLKAAERRGRKGGRPPVIDQEKIDAAIAMLEAGKPMAATARALEVARPTLISTLKRVGWKQAA